MTAGLILVTGATGRIGRAVADSLAQKGVSSRLLLRRPGTDYVCPSGSQLAFARFEDQEAMAAALTGVERLFLYTPNPFEPALFSTLRQSSVKRVVLLSSASVAKVAEEQDNPVSRRHRMAEKMLKESEGLEWVILRPDVLASNALQWAGSIKAKREVRVAYPQSLRNPIHERDVAAIATHFLLLQVISSQEVMLSGPEVLSVADQVQLLAGAIGKNLSCIQISEEEAIKAQVSDNPQMALAAARALIDYQRATVSRVPLVYDDFERIMGYSPSSFGVWAHDNRHAFM